MAKAKYKIEIESWIVLVISVVIFIVALLNKFIPKLNVRQIFVAPTSTGGEFPFSFSDPFSYIRILLHIFGAFSLVSISCCICLVAFIPNSEKEFGTIPLVLMILLSAIFSGVLSACFSKNTISGVEPIVYLLVFLNIFGGLKKKKILVLQLMILALFMVWSLTIPEKPDFIAVLVQIAGGLCGSLISFLTVPKSRKSSVKPKKQKEDPDTVPTIQPWFDNEADSPRFKNKNINPDDTTVVGTIEL